MVQWLELALSLLRVQVQFLAEELGFHQPLGMAKKKKKILFINKAVTN